MSFDIKNRLFKEETRSVSPMSIGGKIKRFRELRGWTQKELGIRCGYKESTADVRIAQYEMNKKAPREKSLREICDALGINEGALFDADLNKKNTMYHALFDIEDLYGLHPVKRAEGYYLEFSGPTILGLEVQRFEFNGFLKEWYEVRQKYLPKSTDTDEEKAVKASEYTLWRGEYPTNVDEEKSQDASDEMQMRRLQAKMDALNAKMKNDKELAKIDKVMENVMSEIRPTHKHITRESELIYLIKNLVEEGVGIEVYSPEESIETDYEYMHLLSIRSEEILNNDSERILIAGLFCALEDIQQYGISILRRIISRNNELFVSFRYPSSQYMFFENLWRHWDDIIDIRNRKNVAPEWEIDPLEEKLREAITGRNDVLYAMHAGSDERNI